MLYVQYRNPAQETRMSDPDRLPNGQFAPGNPGGPGRPRGAVAQAAAALDKAAIEAHVDLMRVVLDQARDGNLEATKMLWARVWPARRERPVAFDLPKIEKDGDLLPAHTAVNDAVLDGELTRGEAAALREVIGEQRKAADNERFRLKCEDIKRRYAEAAAEEDEEE